MVQKKFLIIKNLFLTISVLFTAISFANQTNQSTNLEVHNLMNSSQNYSWEVYNCNNQYLGNCSIKIPQGALSGCYPSFPVYFSTDKGDGCFDFYFEPGTTFEDIISAIIKIFF